MSYGQKRKYGSAADKDSRLVMKHSYITSDAGRTATGLDERLDCAVRALALSTGMPYLEAHKNLCRRWPATAQNKAAQRSARGVYQPRRSLLGFLP